MSHLILIRHGQSKWNLENKFTGWVDIDLTEKGKAEATKAGELLKERNLIFKKIFSSYQLRAINTLKLVLKVCNSKNQIFDKVWQFNERHYGDLTGLNKNEMKKKLGANKIHEFRRSWNIAPNPLSKSSPYHPINIDAYKDIPRKLLPDTESLQQTYERVIPYFKKNILPFLSEGTLIVAHGNSIRTICKFLFKIDDKKISRLEIPTGNPLEILFDKNQVVKSAKYYDNSRAKDLIVF